MKIQVKLDEIEHIENTSAILQNDFEDLLGDILLTSQNSRIFEKSTYIECWISALKEIVKELPKSDAFRVDLEVESNDLVVKKYQRGITILYESQTLEIENANEISLALKTIEIHRNEIK